MTIYITFKAFKSSAILINIFAASVCLCDFLYNSTKSIFLFFSIRMLQNLLTKASIWKKLFFSANSTARFHLLLRTQVSMALLTSPYLKKQSTASSHNPYCIIYIIN